MGALHGGDKAPHVSLDDLIHRKMDLIANPTAQLFAPSEAGYTTDATEFDGSESTSSGGEADSEIDLSSPKQGDSEETVERSAESIGAPLHPLTLLPTPPAERHSRELAAHSGQSLDL